MIIHCKEKRKKKTCQVTHIPYFDDIFCFSNRRTHAIGSQLLAITGSKRKTRQNMTRLFTNVCTWPEYINWENNFNIAHTQNWSNDHRQLWSLIEKSIFGYKAMILAKFIDHREKKAMSNYLHVRSLTSFYFLTCGLYTR